MNSGWIVVIKRKWIENGEYREKEKKWDGSEEGEKEEEEGDEDREMGGKGDVWRWNFSIRWGRWLVARDAGNW